MRSRGIGTSDRVHKCRGSIFEIRDDGCERRMHAEETVEIDDRASRNRDRGTGIVIGLLRIRHHDIPAVNRSALENCHENFFAFRRRGADHLHEDVRKQAAGNKREAGTLQEKSAIDHCRWNSGLPSSMAVFVGSATGATTPGSLLLLSATTKLRRVISAPLLIHTSLFSE